MKLSNPLCFSIVAALAATTARGLVIPNLKDLPAAAEADVSAQNGNVAESHVSEDVKTSESVDNVIVNDIHVHENSIPNSYIVIMKDDISEESLNFHKLWLADAQVQSFARLDTADASAFSASVQTLNFESQTGGIGHSFDLNGLKGYSGLFTSEVVDLLKMSPDVAVIEQDSIVHAIGSDTQEGAPWGLARISHRDTLGLSDYNKYIYDAAGDGVTSYVIDTGVNVSHKQFNGRAKWGATIPSGDADVDGNGHGTHCAGTIGSADYGVSKNANIVAVKVLRSNGSGTMSDVVKGVEFAANDHVKSSKLKGFKGSTANMSLGGGKSPSLDLAVNAAVKAGLHFAVAAGNDNADACNYSPAAAENAITVGASALSDSRAYFSNYGKCVDIFAPGLNILSTYIGSDSATAILSGTSMASPHVAGLLTYFLSLAPSSDSLFSSGVITPKQLKENIIKYGTKNALKDIPDDTPNNLIYNGAGGDLKDFWGVTAEEQEEDSQKSIEAVKEFAANQADGIKEEILSFVEDFVKAVAAE